MKIVGHCLVKNEENFIWFALNSVLPYLDKLMVWDMNSTDKTVAIVKLINSKKIKFKEIGTNDLETVSKLRQEMLVQTDSEWVWIIDGDEVWSDDAIDEALKAMEESKVDVLVSPCYMAIGEIFHFQEELGGNYSIAGRKGHFNIRILRRNISGLHVEGRYPNEAYVDESGVKIQDFDEDRMIFLKEKYLHLSYLKRSSKDRKKFKYEIGEPFPLDFYYPEVFFKPSSGMVPSPWHTSRLSYKLRAALETPLKKMKRRFL